MGVACLSRADGPRLLAGDRHQTKPLPGSPSRTVASLAMISSPGLARARPQLAQIGAGEGRRRSPPRRLAGLRLHASRLAQTRQEQLAVLRAAQAESAGYY